MYTLVTITHPKYKVELAACVASFRHFNPEPFPWLFITEGENVCEVRDTIPGEKVVDMHHIDPTLETFPPGFCRQNAAKVSAINELIQGNVIFTDDDVTAERPWNEGTFTSSGKPVVWFERMTNYVWMFGQHTVYGRDCPRLFQLRLPFAIHADTLRAFRASKYAERARREWMEGNQGISEWQLLGEYAFQTVPKREVLANVTRARQHWTLDLGYFRDWQRKRPAMLEAIASGGIAGNTNPLK